jgi:hypothetical protein
MLRKASEFDAKIFPQRVRCARIDRKFPASLSRRVTMRRQSLIHPFDPAEVILDFAASSVKALRTVCSLAGIAAVRDGRQRAFIFDLLPHFLAVAGRLCWR